MLQGIETILNGGNGTQVAIVTSDGISYTFEDLRLQVTKYALTIEAINPKQVMVSCRNEFLATASFLACLQSEVHFGVCPYNRNTDLLMMKCGISETDLLISDYRNDPHILTLTEHGIGAMSENVALNFESGENLDRLIWSIRSIMDRIDIDELMEVKSSSNATQSGLIFTNFHKGLCSEGFKFSAFTKDKLYIGLEKVSKLAYYSPVTYLESFELLYDIFIGIMGPLASGQYVKFANVNSYESTYESMHDTRTLYSSASTFENVLKLIVQETSHIKWFRKYALLRRIGDYILRRRFKKDTNKIGSIVLTGKIRNIKNVNALKIPITTVYAVGEVASFISVDTHKKLVEDYSVGIVDRKNIQIEHLKDGNYGPILVFAEDMAVTTNSSMIEESFYHKYPGRLNTRDIGFMEDGKLHIIDKDVFVYEYFSGKRIDTARIINRATSLPWCKEALLITNSNSSLVLLVEPDKDYASKCQLRLEDIDMLADELQTNLHKEHNGAFPLSVVVWTDTDGLDRQTYKIIVRDID